MSDIFGFADELGPTKVIHVYEPSVQLRGILVIDNVAAGPSIGGVRMAPDVSVEECFRLARAMTMKNAAAELAHGGGKAVLVGDPKMPRDDKERLLRTMASSLRNVEDYIFAPDMGTDEDCMAWVRDEIGRVVGLPRVLGGIPLDEIGATGWGLAHSAEVAAEFVGLELDGARIAVQGFGAVGKHAARFLKQKGAVLIGASDSRGTVHNPKGLDVDALWELKLEGCSVVDYTDGTRGDTDAIIDLDCEIWIPAARPDVINENNVDRLRTRLVMQGANIPATLEAESILHERGVLCVPDFIANAGGVICAAMEYQRAGESAVFPVIEDKIRRNTRSVLERAQRNNAPPREVAIELATERVHRAMDYRRYAVFSGAPGFV